MKSFTPKKKSKNFWETLSSGDVIIVNFEISGDKEEEKGYENFCGVITEKNGKKLKATFTDGQKEEFTLTHIEELKANEGIKRIMKQKEKVIMNVIFETHAENGGKKIDKESKLQWKNVKKREKLLIRFK